MSDSKKVVNHPKYQESDLVEKFTRTGHLLDFLDAFEYLIAKGMSVSTLEQAIKQSDGPLLALDKESSGEADLALCGYFQLLVRLKLDQNIDATGVVSNTTTNESGDTDSHLAKARLLEAVQLAVLEDAEQSDQSPYTFLRAGWGFEESMRAIFGGEDPLEYIRDYCEAFFAQSHDSQSEHYIGKCLHVDEDAWALFKYLSDRLCTCSELRPLGIHMWIESYYGIAVDEGSVPSTVLLKVFFIKHSGLPKLAKLLVDPEVINETGLFYPDGGDKGKPWIEFLSLIHVKQGGYISHAYLEQTTSKVLAGLSQKSEGQADLVDSGLVNPYSDDGGTYIPEADGETLIQYSWGDVAAALGNYVLDYMYSNTPGEAFTDLSATPSYWGLHDLLTSARLKSFDGRSPLPIGDAACQYDLVCFDNFFTVEEQQSSRSLMPGEYVDRMDLGVLLSSMTSHANEGSPLLAFFLGEKVDPRLRAYSYYSIVRKAKDEGHHALANALLSFFLVSHTLTYDGENYGDVSELLALVGSGLNHPGRSWLVQALDFFRKYQAEGPRRLLGMALGSELTQYLQNSQSSVKEIHFRVPSEEQIEATLIDYLGRDNWDSLGERSKVFLVSAEYKYLTLNAAGSWRVADWGSSANDYFKAIEYELKSRAEKFWRAPELISFLGSKGRKAENRVDVGNILFLLSMADRLPHGLLELMSKQAWDTGKLKELGKVLAKLSAKRNSGSHDSPFNIADLIKFRIVLFDNGELRRFVSALI